MRMDINFRKEKEHPYVKRNTLKLTAVGSEGCLLISEKEDP